MSQAGAGATGAFGPAGEPGSDADRLWRRVLWALPTGLYLVGSRDGASVNVMTANLAVQVATEPRAVAVAVETGSVTEGLVAASGAFALALLERSERAIVRRFVKPVQPDQVEWSAGRLEAVAGVAVLEVPSGAPVPASALAWVDCAVRHAIPVGSHLLVVGEVTDIGVPGGRLPDAPDVLRMEDTRMHYGG